MLLSFREALEIYLRDRNENLKKKKTDRFNQVMRLLQNCDL